MQPSKFPNTTADSVKLNHALSQLQPSARGKVRNRYTSEEGTGEHTAVSAQFFSSTTMQKLPPILSETSSQSSSRSDSVEEYVLPAIGIFLLASLAFWLFAYPVL